YIEVGVIGSGTREAKWTCVESNETQGNVCDCVGELNVFAEKAVGFRAAVDDKVSVLVFEGVEKVSVGFKVTDFEVALIVCFGEVGGRVFENVEGIVLYV